MAWWLHGIPTLHFQVSTAPLVWWLGVLGDGKASFGGNEGTAWRVIGLTIKRKRPQR